MIKTKSILSKTGYRDDGTRICIMRYIKIFYDFDEHIVNLAPSAHLLNQYQGLKITWNKFSSQYIDEMLLKYIEIARLRQRSDSGEVITLLCWEWSPDQCHRSILKKLIDNCFMFTNFKKNNR